MKRHLFGLSLALATIALLAFARSAWAENSFKLTGTVTEVVLLGFTEDTYTLQITVYGEGSVGNYKQISIVAFAFLGDTTWAFEDETTIYILNEKGKRTRDEIYLVATGVNVDGRFEITGGQGLYEGAGGNGAFKYDNPTATYTGVIRWQ